MWRKQNRKFPLYFRLMGYVMLIVGIGLIVNGIKDYAEQSRQNDWLTTQATVTDVSSHVVRSHGSGNRSSTYYTLVYEYTVNGETYTGKSGQLSSPRLVGDVITVKYDPEAPEESTTTLSPHTRDLVVLLVLGTAIAVAGFFSLGCRSCFAIFCERNTRRSRRNRFRKPTQGLMQRPLQRSRRSSGFPGLRLGFLRSSPLSFS